MTLTASETCFYCLHADFKAEANGTMRGFARCTKAKRLKIEQATTLAATSATKANLTRQQPTLWKNGARNLKNGATKGNDE